MIRERQKKDGVDLVAAHRQLKFCLPCKSARSSGHDRTLADAGLETDLERSNSRTNAAIEANIDLASRAFRCDPLNSQEIGSDEIAILTQSHSLLHADRAGPSITLYLHCFGAE